jgi:cytochrome b561
VTWLPAAVSFAAALILQDCVLLALAGLLCVRGFYWSMDRAAPLTAGNAALRCLAASLALLVLAIIFSVVGITALVGWWTPSPKISEMTLVLVVASVALPSLPRLIWGFGGSNQMAVDVLATTAFVGVILLRDSGLGALTCVQHIGLTSYKQN